MIINNVLSCGYQCTTDHFLEKFKLRKQSSPFSYMIIDIKSANSVIDTNFESYLANVEYVNNVNEFMWFNRYWDQRLFVNMTLTKDFRKNKRVNENESVCVWNHHDISDPNTCITLNRRCDRFKRLYPLDDTLVLYIHKIKDNISDVTELIEWCKTLKYNICVLFPIHNHGNCINEIFRSKNVLILSYKSSYRFNSNDIHDNTIDWNGIYKKLLTYYTF